MPSRIAVQQQILVNCLADLDDCSRHLEPYLRVTSDCTDNAVDIRGVVPPQFFAKNKMRRAVTAYAIRLPPPPSCDIDTLQISFAAIETACCVGVRANFRLPFGESKPTVTLPRDVAKPCRRTNVTPALQQSAGRLARTWFWTSTMSTRRGSG